MSKETLYIFILVFIFVMTIAFSSSEIKQIKSRWERLCVAILGSVVASGIIFGIVGVFWLLGAGYAHYGK